MYADLAGLTLLLRCCLHTQLAKLVPAPGKHSSAVCERCTVPGSTADLHQHMTSLAYIFCSTVRIGNVTTLHLGAYLPLH